MCRFPPCVRPLAVLGITAFLLGCGADQPAQPPLQATEPAAVAAPVIAPSTAPAATADHTLLQTGIIQELNLGDRACYVTVEDAASVIYDLMAVMELCERDELIGRSVRFEYELGQVIAESCQGDPECSDTEMAHLVVDVAPTAPGR